MIRKARRKPRQSDEYATISEAIDAADYLAAGSECTHYVLTNGQIFWVCGPNAKRELWPEKTPVYVAGH